jgi:hypothetical protein
MRLFLIIGLFTVSVWLKSVQAEEQTTGEANTPKSDISFLEEGLKQAGDGNLSREEYGELQNEYKYLKPRMARHDITMEERSRYDNLLRKVSEALRDSRTPVQVTIKVIDGGRNISGATIRYRFIGRKDDLRTATQPSPSSVEMSAGYYFIWAEREGAAITDKSLKFLVGKKTDTVTILVTGLSHIYMNRRSHMK